MREIKFRAWDKNRKEWVKQTGNPNVFPFNGKIAVKCNGDAAGHITDEDWSHSFDLQQFTGLLDKQGKEIYEGDILLIPDTYKNIILDDGSGPTEDFNHLSQVIFNNGCFGVDIKEAGDLWEKGFVSFPWMEYEMGEGPKYFEVIGNAYENPELLEGIK